MAIYQESDYYPGIDGSCFFYMCFTDLNGVFLGSTGKFEKPCAGTVRTKAPSFGRYIVLSRPSGVMKVSEVTVVNQGGGNLS